WELRRDDLNRELSVRLVDVLALAATAAAAEHDTERDQQEGGREGGQSGANVSTAGLPSFSMPPQTAGNIPRGTPFSAAIFRFGKQDSARWAHLRTAVAGSGDRLHGCPWRRAHLWHRLFSR